MCHNNQLKALPTPGSYQLQQAHGLKYWQYDAIATTDAKSKKVMVLTDIYGCNEFYQSFATYLAEQGFEVSLIDLYSDLGELKEITREAAFERRHLLRDQQICNQLETFIEQQQIDALVGFCLGGNYALELAKRNVETNLIAYYPFPNGLPNEDGIEVPINYMADLVTPITLLVGDSDDSAGRESIANAVELAKSNSALKVHLYQQSGHGFLAQLDSEDKTLRQNAEDSLAVCLEAITQDVAEQIK